MLSNNVFYHGTIRKTIIAFGALFSNIYIDRKVGATGIDSVNGTTIQRLHVPIAYGPKEKWVIRIEQDPTLQNYTYTALPFLSFEINGYAYDTTRKLNKMNKIVCNTAGSTGATGVSNSIFTPVPYNLDMSLYVITKTQEDALQIIEQILPTFGPEYTLAVNVIPSMFLIQNIPVVLNSITVDDSYDGAFQTRRFVIHTLNFTLKLNLFGGMQTNKQIYTSMANISMNADLSSPGAEYKVKGDPQTYTVIPNSEDPESDIWIEGL